MKLDVLVIAAHPDDAEISAGGTILRLTRAGKKVGIVDMTRGEMGTRGSAEDRDRETQRQNGLARAGLALRQNLELPDGRVLPHVEARERLAALIRECAPDLVLAHHTEDLHPDHAADRRARSASVVSLRPRASGGTNRRSARQTPAPLDALHEPRSVRTDPRGRHRAGVGGEVRPGARLCQPARGPRSAGPRGKHFFFGADILVRMETRARTWGERIGARYGEPLLHRGPLPCDLSSWCAGPG